MKKRRAFFDYYRNRTDILCIQETHCIQDKESTWRLEWNGRAIFSHGTKSSGGVCILFKKEFYCNIEEIQRDTEGRMIMCKIQVDPESSPVTLCCIYAPNKDSPVFFDNVAEHLANYAVEQKIIIGDFNLVLNTKLDRNQSAHNNNQALAKLNQIIDEYYLTDIWRERNPNMTRYSWRRLCNNQHSRIDFALVSQGFSNLIENCTYIASILTDHSALYLYVSENNNKRGPGYWKLNTSLLQNTDACERITSEITEIKSSGKEPVAVWTKIKRNVAKICQELGRQTASEEKEVIANLSEVISDYEDQLPLDEKTDLLYQKTKCDLENIMLGRAQKLIFRSKSRWYELGERNTRYFYNLEKTRYNARTCKRIHTEDGKILTEDPDILQAQEDFYRRLYAKDENVCFSIKNNHNVKISSELYRLCEAPITMLEIESAIKSMKTGRTPGEDGLPIEFYSKFINSLKQPLTEMIQTSFEKKELHDSALSGILNLIPKQGKDSRFLKNLRPITLLNVDYKIIEKTLAARLDVILRDIIHGDQTGFMAGRRISSNIRKIFDVMQYCKNKNIEGVLINLDFAKCFDNIAFSAIIGSLQFFGVPNYIQEWVKILYQGFHIKVQNNGKFTHKIPVEKSVHQGGCLSVQLFLFCAEIIALELRQCQQIKGIPVDEIIHLLNQYADDMNVSSLYDESSICAIFQKLQWFHRNAGFRINYNKTELYRIGSLHGSEATLYTQNTVRWTNQPINILGVTVDYHTDNTRNNYTDIFRRMKATLLTWSNRKLSLFGKINVINTLVASLFVYKLTVLPKLPQDLVNKIQNMFNEFLWGGRKAKIPLKILQGSKQTGGANLVNIEQREAALKISWIRTIKSDDKLAGLAYHFLVPELHEYIWQCNIDPADIDLFIARDSNSFWYDVLTMWAQYNFTKDISKASRIIWMNSLIRINDNPVLYKKCIRKGLLFSHQLYRNGRLIGIKEATEFGLSILELNSLVAALPKLWKDDAKTGNEFLGTNRYAELVQKPKISNIVYRQLTDISGLLWSKSEQWSEEIGAPVSEADLVSSIKRIYCISNVPQVRSFHYRLLCRGLVLNMHLYKWKMRDDNVCSQCELYKETYGHLFYSCEIMQKTISKSVQLL